jgi:parallel beta-helix repeat protein
MSNKKYNFGIEGQSLEDFIQRIDDLNKVDGKPICYLVNEHDKIISAGAGFGFVALINSDNVTINGSTLVTLTKNRYGLLLINTNNSKIDNFVISKNDRYGIYLRSSSKNEITKNKISSEQYSIVLEASNSNIVSQNRVGVGSVGTNSVDGIFLNASSGNEIKSNTIQNINEYGIHIIDSSSNTIDSNDITQYEEIGILLENSASNILTNNSITGKQRGESYCGIRLVSSSYNEINMSTIVLGYDYGISLGYSSSSNRIYHNTFLWNLQEASATSYSNVWDDGYPSGGNYWSDYIDTDNYKGPHQDELGKDEIYDHAYAINNFNKDRYPLVNSIHDVAVVNITLSKSIMKRGGNVDINVTVENQGFSEENFDVKIYYNEEFLDEVQVTLEGKISETVFFQWNTTQKDVPAGNYTIKANATYVRNEIDFSDNNYTDGILTIEKGECDMNNDGKVNLSDLIIVAGAFGAQYNETDGKYWHDPLSSCPTGKCLEGKPHDAKCDVNGDHIVNLSDLIGVAREFG